MASPTKLLDGGRGVFVNQASPHLISKHDRNFVPTITRNQRLRSRLVVLRIGPFEIGIACHIRRLGTDRVNDPYVASQRTRLRTVRRRAFTRTIDRTDLHRPDSEIQQYNLRICEWAWSIRSGCSGETTRYVGKDGAEENDERQREYHRL